MGDRQGESSQCDMTRKGHAVSECCETQVLDHGSALVISVVARVPSSVGGLLQEKHFLGGRDFFGGSIRFFVFVLVGVYRQAGRCFTSLVW